jgi:hypothetical protein
MKIFTAELYYTEEGKKTVMVEHHGLTFDDIDKIENFINELKRKQALSEFCKCSHS